MLFSFTKFKKKNKEKSKWKNKKNLNNRREMEKEQVHCYQVWHQKSQKLGYDNILFISLLYLYYKNNMP